MSETKVITGTVRLSYAQLWEPKEDDEGRLFYSTSLLIPKDDTRTLAAIKKAVEAAKAEGKSSKWNGKIPANLKTPLRDGDEEDKGPDYEGHYFLNCKSKNKPQIVKPGGKDKNGKNKFIEIDDETEVYSGCYARVSINFYPFSGKSNGIAVGLNSVVKVQDGEPLGGSFSRAEDDFADEEFEVELEEDWMN